MPPKIIDSLRIAVSSGAYFRRSVLRRFAVFMALALPLVWLLAGIELARLGTIAQKESNRDLQNLARAFSEEVRATVRTVDMSLIQLRSHWTRNNDEFRGIVTELNSHLEGKVLLHVAVTDRRGRMQFSSKRLDVEQLDASGLEHFRVHLQGGTDRLAVSRPMMGHISRVWTVQFTRPIYDRVGRLAGVIGASVAPSYFSRFHANIDLGPDASVALIRDDGTVIARTTRDGRNADMGKVLAGIPSAETDAVSGHFRRVSRLDGVERFYAWHKLPEYGLTVSVGQSVATAKRRYATQESSIIYTASAVSFILALFAWSAAAATDNRRRAVTALAAAEARWKLALTASGEGVWDCDLARGQALLSPRAQVIIGAEGSTVPCDAATLHRCVHPDDLPEVMRALREHFAGRSHDYVVEHRIRRGGEWVWIRARAMVAERSDDGRALRLVGTFADIDARKSEEEQMRHMAHHDGLTGLPNRVLFGDRLRQAVLVAQREGGKVAVIYFDLDKFKPVNDTYGHAVGDRLLQMMAERVRGGLRESDTLARVGGDEFVVLLPKVGSAADAAKVAENILALLNQPFEAEGLVLNISGSLGVALYPDCGGEPGELLACADKAMYDAKAAGRGRVCAYRAPVAA